MPSWMVRAWQAWEGLCSRDLPRVTFLPGSFREQTLVLSCPTSHTVEDFHPRDFHLLPLGLSINLSVPSCPQLWLQLCSVVLGSGWPACPSAPPEKLSSAGRVPQGPGGEGPVSRAAKLPWSASPSGHQAHNSLLGTNLGNTKP